MDRPRVGILSMQRIANYGSFLQAWGLRSLLEGLGCEVRFVDYKPGPCLEVSRERVCGNLSRKFVKAYEALSDDAPFSAKLAYVRHKCSYGTRFWPLLDLPEQPETDPESLDLLVIGSDEMFNCVQANPNVGFTPALFGQGIRARRKVTYAASFGNTTLDKLGAYGVAEKVGGWLRALDAISVRDANSAAVVATLAGRQPELHLDPVLVYDFMGECERIPSEVDEKKSYMILYGYSGRFSCDECAAVRSYADKHGLRVLNIGGVQGCCDCFCDCTPFEAVAYFAHAEAVVTDTFHGTILATITERPFATFVRQSGYGNFQKLDDLLHRLGLWVRATDATHLASTLDAPIDWNSTSAVITEGRTATLEYLAKQVSLCRVCS